MKVKVIIVEDNETLLTSLVDVFEFYKDNFDVKGFLDAESALNYLEQNEADIIITDVRLPNMSGIDFIIRAKKRKKHTRFVVMTAYGNEEIRKLAKERGAIMYLEKPFDLKELIHKVNMIARNEKTFRARNLQGISLIDILQILNIGKHSTKVTVKNLFNETGILYVKDGEVIHAEFKSKEGKEAFEEILSWESGEFETSQLPAEFPISIRDSLPNLLLNTMKIIDEANIGDDFHVENNVEHVSADVASDVNLRKFNLNKTDQHLVKEEDVMVKQEKIEQILDSLRGIEGSYGAVLVSDDGMIIASRLDKRFAADKVAALASNLIASLKKVITELNFGEPQTLLVEGDIGKVSITEAPGGGMFIMLVGSADMNLGMARMILQEAIEKIV